MSGISGLATIERGRSQAAEAAWGASARGNVLTATIENSVHLIGSPIKVSGDELEINSSLLDIGRVYTFEYLGSQMAVWKLPSGAVDLYEIVE